MTKQKEPLHEWILRLVYLEHPEKPEPMSTEDILWKIDDPTVSLHKVKEVLDWLVRKNDMEVQFGKYKLDRIKFLELKEENRHLVKEAVPVVNYYNINNKNEKKKKFKKDKVKDKIIIAPITESVDSRRLVDVPSTSDNSKKWMVPGFIMLAFLLSFVALNSLDLKEDNENKLALFSLDKETDFITNKHGIGNIRSLKEESEMIPQINQKIGLLNKQLKYLLGNINDKDQGIKELNNTVFENVNNEIELIKEENFRLWLTTILLFSFNIILLIYFIFKNK